MKQTKKELLISFTILAGNILVYFFFALSLIFKWQLLLFISAALLIIGLLVSSVYVLLSKNKLTVFDLISVGFELLTSTVLSAFFIASITEETIRTVVTAIMASYIGGLFTLLGVGLTIKHNRFLAEDEERKKFKPRVFPISDNTKMSIKNWEYVRISTNDWKTNLQKADGGQKHFYIHEIFLYTLELNTCIYDGIVINGEPLLFDFGQVLLPNKNYRLSHRINFILHEEIKSVSLLITDLLDNTYEFPLLFDIKEIDGNYAIHVTSAKPVPMTMYNTTAQLPYKK